MSSGFDLGGCAASWKELESGMKADDCDPKERGRNGSPTADGPVERVAPCISGGNLCRSLSAGPGDMRAFVSPAKGSYVDVDHGVYLLLEGC